MQKNKHLYSLGLKLKPIRKSQHKTLSEVSTEIGISRNTLSKYERNADNMPVSVFIRLMEYYGVDMRDII